MRNEYVLDVRTSNFEDMGYNIKRDGWLNNFTNEKNQSMREDGVPWRGAREKPPDFFSIIFSALMDKDDTIMYWQCGIGLFFISLFFNILSSFILVLFPIHFYILIFLHFDVLRGSIIACHSIQRHIVCVSLFLASNLLACICVFSDRSFGHVLILNFFSHLVCS